MAFYLKVVFQLGKNLSLLHHFQPGPKSGFTVMLSSRPLPKDQNRSNPAWYSAESCKLSYELTCIRKSNEFSRLVLIDGYMMKAREKIFAFVINSWKPNHFFLIHHLSGKITPIFLILFCLTSLAQQSREKKL